jgi:ribosome maturation factor RimP
MAKYSNAVIFEDVEPIVKNAGFEIVELKGTERREALHVFIAVFRKEGVTADDCAEIHRLIKPRIELIMERQDISLEVASPGISRTLKSPREYKIFSGKGIKILLKNEDEWILGIIKQADEHQVEVNTGEETVSISLDNIQKAKLDYTQEVK